MKKCKRKQEYDYYKWDGVPNDDIELFKDAIARNEDIAFWHKHNIEENKPCEFCGVKALDHGGLFNVELAMYYCKGTHVVNGNPIPEKLFNELYEEI